MESEVFGWSRIAKNTRSGRRIFCPTLEVQLNHFFLHHTPKLGIPDEMVQFLSKLSLKQRMCTTISVDCELLQNS